MRIVNQNLGSHDGSTLSPRRQQPNTANRLGNHPRRQAVTPLSADLFRVHEAFALRTAPTMGVEIELFLLDQWSGQPAPLFEDVYRKLPRAIQQHTTNEFLKCQIEYATPKCWDAQQCGKHLVEFAEALTAAADKVGAIVSWRGALDDWVFDPAIVFDCPRSRSNILRFGEQVAYLATCSMHVHVAVPRMAAIQVIDRIQEWIPEWVAMTANSPTMHGRREGMASHRADVWANGFPISGFPHRYGNWDGFYQYVGDLARRGLVRSQKDLYLYSRPTRFGTVEIRCCDIPSELATVVEVADSIQQAVIQCQRSNGPLAPLSDLQRRFDDACRYGCQMN